MIEKAKNENGFTLVELLAALTIFAVGLLSVAQMQVTALTANATANGVSVASSVAQGVMEEILSRDGASAFFSTAAANQDWDFDDATVGVQPVSVAGAGDFSAVYSVTTDTPVTNVTRIDVTASGPGSRTVTLTSYRKAL